MSTIISTDTLKQADLPGIIGLESVKEQLKSALLIGRNIILVGPPGIGKTFLAKEVAKLLQTHKVQDCGYHCLPDKPVCPVCKAGQSETVDVHPEDLFVRIQGSPDLTAEDLIGDIDPLKAIKFGPLSIEAFTPGKIFKANNGILFFDEINRCSEKLQNALLQVLQEKKATIGSYDVDLDADFIFIGTMNPDDSSTERLSEAFLDRFDLIYTYYPETHEHERDIVLRYGKSMAQFPDALLNHIVRFVRDMRDHPQLERAPSVRASLGLYERAQANAVLGNRDTVSFADIARAVKSVLGHRVSLKASVKYLKSPEEFVSEEFDKYAERNNLSSEEST